MSRVFTAATGQHLTYTGSMGITARPVTLFMWTKFTTVAATRNALSYDNTSAANMRITANTSGVVRLSVSQTTGANSTTTGVPSTGAWLPIIGIYDAGGNTDLYALGESVLNGGAAGAFIAESSPKFSIGCNTYQAAIPSIDAKIAHVAMWSTELDSTDRAALIAGADPSTISPGSLIEYWALTDASLTGVNGRVLSVTGTVNSDAGDNPTVGGGTVTGTGALAAQSAVVAGAATTFQVVTGASILIDSSSMFLNLDFAPVDGDKVGIPRDWLGSALTLAANGTFTITPALPNGTEIPRISYDASATTWYEDVATINDSGALTIYASGALAAQSATVLGFASIPGSGVIGSVKQVRPRSNRRYPTRV
jgi:hypothetical protein